MTVGGVDGVRDMSALGAFCAFPQARRMWYSSAIMAAAPDSPNTVDTIEDIIRILREKPEIREAARREILTDELLELPEKVAQIITIQQQILERLDRHGEQLAAHGKTLAAHGKTLAAHGKRLDRIDVRLDGIDVRLDGIDGRLDGLASKVSRLGGKVSRLEGLAAMQVAEKRYALIALEMGLDEPRMLSLVEIAKMAMGDAASEYTESELNSFRDCDIIMSARSSDGGESYVAVQVSTTIDHDDIRRAIDHAKMVERFTGRPARPAVAGFGSVQVAERRLSSGAVHWHRMPSSGMNPR